MPTVPRAGLVKPEDSLDIASHSRIYLRSPLGRSDTETKGKSLLFAEEDIGWHIH